jgi:hypothetical protein
MSGYTAVPLIVVAVVPKNKLEEVRIALSQYKGADLLDVRVYAADEGVGAYGKKHPTRKGIAIKVSRLPELIAGLRAAQAEAIKLGLITAKESGAE